MKNLIIVPLLALVLLIPSLSFAQTVSQEQVNQQLLALIDSLMKQVQDLMKQLVEIQTKQVAQTQALNTIQEQVTPTVSVGAAVVSGPELTLQQRVDNKYAEMKASCADLNKQYRTWSTGYPQGDYRAELLKKPGITTQERYASTYSDEFIDSVLKSNIEKQLQGQSISTEYCPTWRFSGESNLVCQKVAEIQAPYLSCMLGQ